MAKITFNRLGLTKNQEIKTLIWNDQTIEVKQYLPTLSLLQIVENVINQAHDPNYNFSNPIKAEVYTVLEIVYNFTNISFTDKQKEDPLKLFDLIVQSGLYKQIIELISNDQYKILIETIQKSITSIYAYQNSVLGILDTIKADYASLDLNATSIQEKLADQENLQLLKDIMNKLG